MYLINKNTIQIISVPKPNDFYINDKGEITVFTNLQVAYMNLLESDRINYFEQQELPTCDPKYYKISDNTLVEMNETEKKQVDRKEDIQRKILQLNWLQPDRMIRISVLSDLLLHEGKYETFGNDIVKQGVPLIRTNNEDPSTDISTGYFLLLRKKDGFTIDENGNILNLNLPDIVIEQLASATETELIIKIES